MSKELFVKSITIRKLIQFIKRSKSPFANSEVDYQFFFNYLFSLLNNYINSKYGSVSYLPFVNDSLYLHALKANSGQFTHIWRTNEQISDIRDEYVFHQGRLFSGSEISPDEKIKIELSEQSSDCIENLKIIDRNTSVADLISSIK